MAKDIQPKTPSPKPFDPAVVIKELEDNWAGDGEAHVLHACDKHNMEVPEGDLVELMAKHGLVICVSCDSWVKKEHAVAANQGDAYACNNCMGV